MKSIAPDPGLDLEIGGLVSLSTVDDPGHLAAVVFCQGCPWRCRYCHNPALLPRRSADAVSWQRLEDFLGRRRGLLESVVFSGGEPTLQEALPRALERVRRLGFRVGLHTAGIVPDRLARVLSLVDWVGIDIKAPFRDYRRITCSPRSGERARRSLDLVLEAAATVGLAYEVRTTHHPDLLTEQDLLCIGHELADRRVHRWAVQGFRPDGCADPELGGLPAPALDPVLHRQLASCVEELVLR